MGKGKRGFAKEIGLFGEQTGDRMSRVKQKERQKLEDILIKNENGEGHLMGKKQASCVLRLHRPFVYLTGWNVYYQEIQDEGGVVK